MCLRCVFDGCAALRVGIEKHQNMRISQRTFENNENDNIILYQLEPHKAVVEVSKIVNL